MIINKQKYRNAIVYICKSLGGRVRGKKKLAKLLYYLDFDHYELSHSSVTGDAYKALPMGPVPVSLGSITTEMEHDGQLSISQVTDVPGYLPTEVYECVAEPDMTVFNDDEIKILNRVIKKYGDLTGKELESLTHEEAPYIGTERLQNIPYELSYYRGTDFSDI